MKPVIASHFNYRASLIRRMEWRGLRWRTFPSDLRDTYLRFRSLDLSDVDRIMQDNYSARGPCPRQPSCMFRSLLLMVETKCPSIPLWVSTLHASPLYAILSGFDPDDLPSVGTFYDFLDRLWNLNSPNFAPHLMEPYKKKLKKPKEKGAKAASVEKESVADLILRLSAASFSSDHEAYGPMFRIFRSCFLNESIRRGHISLQNLTIAGDGTPLVTAARFRFHHSCDCWKRGVFDCNCKRFYPQPDCDIGWDSSRELWYFGYDLYLLTDADSDLSLFPALHRASMHDSHGFCEAFFRFRALAPDLKPKALLLDSAHDSMAMYNYCQRESIVPFIDLNLGNTKKTADYNGVKIGQDSIPICTAGLKMKSNGNDLHRQYAKFRCPLNNNGSCTCQTPCSDAKFGRTCSIPLASNIRLYTSPPRQSDEWMLMYNKRTASERVNKLLKLDYKLEACKHHSTKYWYARVYLTMMLIHLSKWKVQ